MVAERKSNVDFSYFGPNFLRLASHIALDSFLTLARFLHCIDRRANSCFSCGVASSLLYDPGGKLALGLLGCPESGQLSDFHGLNGRANSTPAAANPYVFSQVLSKFNHSAL